MLAKADQVVNVMPSDLSDNFFLPSDGSQPRPKVTVSTAENYEEGTVKVVWIPFSMRCYDPEKYENEKSPRSIRYPGFSREEAEQFYYWLRCIARWSNIERPENIDLSEDPNSPLQNAIMEYPLGVLYNPKKDTVERINFDSGKHFDWKRYSPNGPEFREMKKYFEGFLSREVDSNEFRNWFFEEIRNRVDESVELNQKRKDNPRSDISYAKRGYWLEERPET